MIRKFFLISIMGLTLAGAMATSTPFAVLLAMAGLILVALSSATRSDQQK